MNNLTAEVRADKNGKLVTRHVRTDDGSNGSTLNAPVPSVQATAEEAVQVLPKQRTVTINPARLNRAIKRLESANRRLERAGMEAFTWQVQQREQNLIPRREGFGGLTEYVEVVDLVIDYPEVKTATHDFVGSLTQEEAGMITRLSDGVDLGDWRPKESYCDHCGTNRRRNFTVIVRDHETGECSQIGSSCVEGYLGVDPSHLFSLNFNPLDDETEDLSESHKYGGFSSYEHKADVRKALALAFVLTNDGAEYQKRTDWWRGIPSERNKSDISTYSGVLAGLRDVDEKHIDYEWTKEVQARAEEKLNDGSVDGFITEMLNDPDANNEYIQNLKVLMSGDQCHIRNLGALVSSVAVYYRKHQAERQAEEQKKSGELKVNEWLGKPEGKLADINAKIERVKYTEGAYGMTTIITMRAESGHELTWFASNNPDVGVGDKVNIASTTIKSHNEWQGNKSTQITRTKMKVTEAAERKEEDAY